jgi:hypothetical protein
MTDEDDRRREPKPTLRARRAEEQRNLWIVRVIFIVIIIAVIAYRAKLAGWW